MSELTPFTEDAYLDLPLQGVQLIEASAGTGKTYTLATLVTRLVVERELRLGQILAVTFTEAATQELRARLRKRLALAAEIAGALAKDPASSPDDTPEALLTHRIIQQRLQFEDANSLHDRLLRAGREIDLAAVFTIHGFCARVLAEHALQTGQAFDPPDMVGNARALRDEVAADLWRAYGAIPGDAELLQILWKQPDDLAKDLSGLLSTMPLLPPPPDDTPDPGPALQAALATLADAFARHGAQARADLDAAIAAKHIDGRKARAASYEKAWAALATGLEGSGLSTGDAHLDKLTPTRLGECAKAGFEQALPTSPLFNALADWFAAVQARNEWLAAQAMRLLHRIRDDAHVRLARLKHTLRLQTYDDLIAGVADALAGDHGDALVAALRRQYAVALVDEFQDTDARQWAIFRRVFAQAGDGAAGPATTPSLFLIGDPKQAIYGFRGGDVHTYLDAKQDASLAPPLAHNFRSRPTVLRAIETLYAQAGPDAFVDEAIRFHPVEPGAGNSDDDYQRDGHPAPALTVRTLPDADDGKQHKADDSRALATKACVAEIRAVLLDARAGKANIRDMPVRPGDIAVLVRSHKEATRMQAALVVAGIPAVAAGKQSLFESTQALELLAVFEALLQPADEGRLRAALSTMLLGVDGAGIARLDTDGDLHRKYQLDALHWRDRWQRHGPLALVTELSAANAERLLTLVDGERRLTNLLQLGELLQEANARALGMHGLVDWLRTQIAEADRDDEAQQLRLESDARCVQILTLHKSKGLEFALVFLPFAGVGRKPETPSRHCRVPGANGGTLHWKTGRDEDTDNWSDAVDAWQREQSAEDARLLYVGLTRARHALWLAHGNLYNAGKTALAPMLHSLDALQDNADIRIDAQSLPTALPALAPESTATVPPARTVKRTLSRDWWVYSFTQLSRAGTGEDTATSAADLVVERGGDDERASASEAVDAPEESLSEASSANATPADDDTHDPRFSGARFGLALHGALEHVAFDAWRDWHDDETPPAQDAILRAALRGEGYPDADLDDGSMQLATLVGHTLTTLLPEGIRLCDLPAEERRAELEFHFSLQSTSTEALLALLHAHGMLQGRHAFGARQRIEGLMTGKIDLTYCADGRYYLLDYKSNRLPGYDDARMAQAMAHSEYDLQALIYTVALHRWLRFRLGDGYDYDRDFGGARYLFCRGLGAGDGHGIHAFKPTTELVLALDTLFAGGDA